MSRNKNWQDDPLAFYQALNAYLQAEKFLNKDEFIISLSVTNQKTDTENIAESSIPQPNDVNAFSALSIPASQNCVIRFKRVWDPQLRKFVTISFEECS